jgi:transcription elongation factor Elf1
VPTLTLYSGSTAVSSGYKSTASNIKAIASDSVSGVKNIYVKTPSASSYSTYTSSTTMSTNGTYYFYAVDNTGNTSSTVSISLDNTKPTITSSVTGSTISQAFTITATDNIGTPTLYFKKPGASSYSQSSSNSMTIPITSADGTYSFYAVDGYGNVSNTYSVNFYVAPPTATIVRPTNGNIACVVWSDSNCSATLNGNYYNSGTWITAEGNYTFTLINEANRTTTLEFSIEHYYVASNSVSPTCTEQGYTIYKCQNCGDTYNADFVSALGHTYVTSVVAPTCTEEGYTLHTCTRCGYSYKDNYTDMLGHTYGNWYTVTSPTCTATGVSRRDCKDCTHYETRTDNALGHNYTSTITAPTCTAQGYTTHTCTRCTSSYTDTYVAALGHSYKEVVTKPTCTQRGYTTHTCSRCNTSYVDSYTEATGHSMKDWYTTKAATCTATGIAKRDCSKCDYSETKILPVLGHDYIETVTAPTCTERGYSTFVCSRCKDTYIDNWVNELGHDYKEEVIAPTCLEEGYTLHKCVRCGDSYKTDAVTMLGHNYIEDYVTATCEEAGYLLHTCLRCGEEYRSEIVNPSGHDYETNIVLTASCAEDGERYFHCVKCGETHYETIPARGHDYTIVDSEHDDGVVYRTYTCSICGYAYDMKIGEEYEQISNYIEYLFDQYSPYMVWVFLATAGVWSIAMGVALIIAKKNEDQAKAKRMIVNYVIGLVTIFIILVAAPYLVRGIALLISS